MPIPPDRPRFRRDLVAGAIEADDVQYVDVTDPRSGTSFRFYDFEHAVALALDGRPLEAVANDLREDTGIQLSLEQLRSFVGQLSSLGFLQAESPPAQPVREPGSPPPVEEPGREPPPEREPPRPNPPVRDPAIDNPSSPGKGPALAYPPPLPDAVFMPEMDTMMDTTMDTSEIGVIDDRAGSDDPTVLRPIPSRSEEVTRIAPYARREDGRARGGGADREPQPLPAAAFRPAAPERHDASDDDAIHEISSITMISVDEPLPVDSGHSDDGLVAGAIDAPDVESLPPVSPFDRPRRRASVLVYALLGTSAAAVIGLFAFQGLSTPSAPAAVSVHTVPGTPSSVHVWFDATADVLQGGTRTLAFPASGRVSAIAPAGTKFAAGDTLATLQTAGTAEKQAAHYRSRLAYYEKALESAQAARNKVRIRLTQLKVAEKKRLIAEAESRLGRSALIAEAPGEVQEPVAAVGALVKAKAPAVRIKGTTWQVVLELSREDAARLRRLGFCRAELVDDGGKALPCALAASGGDETHVVIDLPNDPLMAAGKKVRVAKGRFHDVFAIPATAVVKVGSTDRVYVASPDGRAEARAVTVADRTRDGAFVTQGLDIGDLVIVDPPPHLRADTPVQIAAR